MVRATTKKSNNNNSLSRVKTVVLSRRLETSLRKADIEWKKVYGPSAAPSLWNHKFLRVASSKDKGRFIYTIKDISKKELLLDEKPLLGENRKKLQQLVHKEPRCLELDGGYETCIDKNAFAFGGKKMGIYFHGSLFSHCCDPNAEAKEDSDEFVAIKDISAGSEVTISYKSSLNLVAMSREKKKQHLSEWFEQCKCTVCDT